MSRRVVQPIVAMSLVVVGVTFGASAALAEHPNHAQGFRPEHAFDVSGIENVDLFNRNLTLTIPIGQSYPVGPNFSYQLVLTYTGNVWDWEQEAQGGTDYLQALPRFRSNAGLGWELSLGRFLSGADPLSTGVGATYESPDQSLHELVDGPLHLGGQDFDGVFFSRDSTYLRYKPSADMIEFPDGLKRVFGPDGLERIEDPFGTYPEGNYLEISYSDRTADGVPLTWSLDDSFNRHHEIHFRKEPVTDAEPESSPLREYRLVVESVTLESFDGSDATYEFGYGRVSFPRPCNDPVLCGSTSTSCGDISNVKYPVLTSVTLPDESAYTIPLGAYHIDGGSSCQDRLLNGHLTRLELPTGGAFEWTWGNVRFPEQSRDLGSLPFSGGHNSPLRQAAGITSRRHLDSSGGEVGEWTYGSSIVSTSDCASCEQQTTITDPDGNETTNFFSVDACQPASDTACADSEGFTALEYGLPFTRGDSDGDGRYLSRQVRDVSGKLLRSVYVRYENSGSNVNPRLASERTLFENDLDGDGDPRQATMDLSGFDGLGHYRTMVESGSFPFDSTRTTTTDFNPGRSTTNIPGPNEPWVLGTYDQQAVTESSASGTETATQEFCFDSDTGFLEQTRMWEGTARGAHDVVVTYRDGTSQGTRTDGFVRHERYYGGDGATLGTGGLCNLSLSSPAYGQEHTYTCGVLATSEWTGTNFSTTDRTINCATGLVATSRDTSGLTTSYTYDALGRLTRVTPPTGLAQTNYLYSRYMPPGSENPGPAKVAIRRKNGNEVLAGEQYIFDGLGRVVNEQRDLPQGTVERDTTWTDRGEMDSRETWHPKGAGAQGTTLYSGYDPFGRPGTDHPARRLPGHARLYRRAVAHDDGFDRGNAGREPCGVDDRREHRGDLRPLRPAPGGARAG